jgi:hypothetical protein
MAAFAIASPEKWIHRLCRALSRLMGSEGSFDEIYAR